MTRTNGARRDRVATYYAILVAATFLMASSFIAGKILLAHGVPAFLLVGWRFVLAAAAAVVFFTADDFRAALFPPRFAISHWMTIVMIGVLQTASPEYMRLAAIPGAIVDRIVLHPDEPLPAEPKL
jgi:drug/metabolite transporter (DMT)-like permease